MRTKLGFALVAVLLITVAAQADTIYLKNGSVIKGKVASFADDQFVVMLNTGSDRNLSRAMIYIGDVARIEFDGASGSNIDAVSQREVPSNPPKDSSTTTTTTSAKDTRANPPPETSSAASREPETEKSQAAPPPPTTDNSEGGRAPSRKSSGPLQTTVIDVVAKRDWTSTGLIVRRGEKIRITATGTVTLDPATGQTSGPDGIDQPDAKKLMPERPTGALIAVIGADNDDFIFVGRSAEFSATRDGLLFLSVNEGTLSDNAGSYKATIERQAQRLAR